ncbi:MAG: response regulator [Spirochaetaceae bacterium]|jgi:chemotaxis protein histidine kinase CheA/ActR/RegA family two-component response regulator|nr:response regulator [Spirochaetaceae bacterium]
MAINKEKYIDKFIDEGIENIATIEGLLFDVREGGSLEDDFVSLLRSLHTLKGSARMLDFVHIETVTHALETVFIGVKEQRINFSDKALRLSLVSLDLLKAAFACIQHTKDDAIETEAFERELTALAANEEFSIPHLESPAFEPPVETQTQAVQEEGAAQGETRRERIEEVKSESIRIPLQKINDIIKNMASLQSLEISAKNISQEMENAYESCSQFLKLVLLEHQINPSFTKELRQLEQALRKIASKMKNYAIDVGNHTKSAYDSVISLRMLPLSTVLDVYPRYVFEIASELDKQVQLRLEGAEHEIDKNIIETLSDVFIHTVRNAIDHGIESPAERRQAGKSETGHLSIRCVRESGSMKIMIADDGRGIDIEGIRKKIVERKLLSPEHAAQLSGEELINYIFQTGFSTSSTVSTISGRGVGMDAVRNCVERMKGSIFVESKQGKGTCFNILVPLSFASLIGFPVSCGEMKFIIPANFVDTVLLIQNDAIITVVDHPGIKFNNHIVKLYYLNHILGIKTQEYLSEQQTFFVVIIKAFDETIALALDTISNMRSVILKSMPSFMDGIRIFSGVVIGEDYEMVPALHIPTLIKMAKRITSFDQKKRYIDHETVRKSILIVDDSMHTREIERDILQAEGYQVDTASDGSEALTAAKNHRYDLICTDLNMPQMDGFMLTESIRKHDELSRIPIIVISSKSSEEEQKHAVMLGANRYIIKNSFNNHNLVTAVRDLIGEAHG